MNGADALDRLAEALAAAPGVRVGIAESEDEREAIHRLRQRQVAAWTGSTRPDGTERDEHDAFALQIGGWADGELVGAMRVVLPAPGRRLPVEQDFDVDIEPSGQVAEAGRLVIAPEHRGDPAHTAWGALFGCAWLSLRAHGFQVLGGAASPRMVSRLRGLGLPFEVLGPEREHWGRRRVPVRLDPAGGDPRWYVPAAPPDPVAGEPGDQL